MTIRYALRRQDVWDAYWFTWRRFWGLKVMHLVIASSAFYIGWRLSGRVGVAILAAILGVAWLPLYPLLRFKPETRTLTIAADGIHTTIRNLVADIAWREIDRVDRGGDRLYIVRHTGHSFAVPDHAFSSADERAAFESQALRWWKEAHL